MRLNFDMLKVFAFALAGVTVITLIKSIAPEHSVLIRLAVVSSVIAVVITAAGPALESINGFSELGSINSAYIKIGLKLTGTAVITQLVSDICRDCNECALANCVELSGRVLMLITALPVISEMIKLSIGIIE